MKTKFLSVSTGITLMFLGVSFFIHSINTVNAASSNSERFLINEPSKIGKYQVSISIGKEDEMYAVIINTESGKSESYRYKVEEGSYKWVKMPSQLPVFTF